MGKFAIESGRKIISRYPKTRELTKRLNLLTPIIQAPMAGINTGAWLPNLVINKQPLYLPSFGAGYMKREAINSEIARYSEKTPVFNFNLFIPASPLENENLRQNLEALSKYLSPYYKKLDVAQPTLPSFDAHTLFSEQVETLIDNRIPVFSFTFGRLPPDYMQAFKANGTYVVGSASSVRGAHQLINDGCDAIVLQSPCAGGHLSLFENEQVQHSTQSAIELVQEAQPINWDVPCIAAGGIRTAEEVQSLFELGVSGIQLGTPFLACQDSAIPPKYQSALSSKNDQESVLTAAISGRVARTIKNDLYRIMSRYYDENKAIFPPYPWAHLLTASLRAAAAKKNNLEYMAAWSGINREKLPKRCFSELACSFLDFA